MVMSLSLPDINPQKILSLNEAKEAIKLLMNSFDNLVHQYVKLEEKIKRLEAENARLKGQPKKPQFAKQKIKHTTE